MWTSVRADALFRVRRFLGEPIRAGRAMVLAVVGLCGLAALAFGMLPAGIQLSTPRSAPGPSAGAAVTGIEQSAAGAPPAPLPLVVPATGGRGTGSAGVPARRVAGTVGGTASAPASRTTSSTSTTTTTAPPVTVPSVPLPTVPPPSAASLKLVQI